MWVRAAAVAVVCLASGCELYRGQPSEEAPPSCGDGVVSEGEECDDGNGVDTDGCTGTCAVARCGDAISSESEACDDGNNVDVDECTNACTVPSCGDAVVSAVEECDDGNDLDADGCTNGCMLAMCGDGIASMIEECDDGNDDDLDACRNSCVTPACGDGLVSTGAGEECEDENDVASDDCVACRDAYCGDGFAHSDEACDDGNGVADDGCESDCAPSIVGIEVGDQSTCIWTRSGAVKCWGDGRAGGNGNGSTLDLGDDETPAEFGFVSVGASIEHLEVGYDQVSAVSYAGTVHCWGDNGVGGLGYGHTAPIGDNEFPSAAGAVAIGGTARSVSVGGSPCVVLVDDTVRCWGWGDWGMNGYANTTTIGDDETPSTVGVVDVGGDVVQTVSGANHHCALLDDMTIRCWGSSQFGQLGFGNTELIGDDETPASAGAVDVGGPVEALVAGDHHTCALMVGGAVRCWGRNAFAQLGYGNTTNVGTSSTPASAGEVDVGGVVTQLAAGYGHTCALLVGGAVRCWGYNAAGELGYGNATRIGDDEDPSSAGDVDVGGPVVQIAAGALRTCALLRTGAVRCWGGGSEGALGYGSTETVGDDETPASVGDVPVF